MKDKTLFYQFSLLLIVMIWGLSFPLVNIAFGSLDLLPMLTLRFATGAIVIWAVVLFKGRKNRGLLKEILNPVALIGGLAIGLFAAAGMLLQSGAMIFTTASKTAFITGLQVVLGPIFGAFFFREKIERFTWIGLSCAIFGLVVFNNVIRFDGGLHLGFDSLNIGDLMVLCCAVLAGIQLNLNAKFSRRCDPLILSVWLLTVMALVPAILWLFFTSGAKCEWANPAMWGVMLVLGPLASGLCFAVLMFAQAKVPIARAVIIVALEPVFGAGFAAVIPNLSGLCEQITPPMIVGGVIMVGSVIITEMWRMRRAIYPSVS